MRSVALLLAAVLAGPGDPTPAVPNWSAPPLWTPPAAAALASGAPEADGSTGPHAIPTAPLVLVGIAPCRVVDTRGTAGVPYNTGGKLAAGESRSYDLNSAPAPCSGIPAGTEAFSVNLTATEPEGPGFLSAFPTGPVPDPLTSILNYATGENVANATVVPADANGSVTILTSTPVHVIVDVNGYYAPLSSQTGAVVTSLAGGTGDLTLSGTNGLSASRAGQDVTLTSNATPSNTASTIVSRDASGNFVAGRIDLNGTHFLSTAGLPLLHRTGSLQNLFLGQMAGGGHATGAANTGLGVMALQSLHEGQGNTAVGFLALELNTTGDSNSAFGSSALGRNVAGCCNAAFGAGALYQTVTSSNSAFGSLALAVNSAGSDNSAFGASALGGNQVGGRNSAFGKDALLANQSGSDNSAFGTLALDSATGSNNSAFGSGAMAATTTGEDGSAFGAFALQANTTGQRNSAFGKDALSASAAANDNAAFGWSALKSCASGNNAAFGSEALAASSTGALNSAFGSNALLVSTTGSDNSGFGTSALNSLSTGSQNVAVGSSAGGVLTTGSNNVYLGYNVDAGGGAESNTIRIGNQTAPPTGGAAHTAVFIGGISGQTVASGVAVLVNGSGELGTATSSRRHKTEIEDVGDRSEVLGKLRPVTFLYREDLDPERVRQYGLVAEEVAEVAPDLVVTGEDGAPLTVRYHLLVPLLLDLVQKQGREIGELRDEIRALRAALPNR